MEGTNHYVSGRDADVLPPAWVLAVRFLPATFPDAEAVSVRVAGTSVLEQTGTGYAQHTDISSGFSAVEHNIDSQTAQKIATSVWRAVETVLFRKGENIHFQKFEKFPVRAVRTNHWTPF